MQSDDGFLLPPALAKLPADRRALTRRFARQMLRDRILLAALEVVGSKGLIAVTVQDLITEAKVARATFYKYFGDKEACITALHDEVLTWLTEEARAAGSAPGDWQGAVRSVSERLLRLLANDPRLARLCTVEPTFGQEAIRARQELALDDLAAALRKGRSERPGGRALPESLEPLLLAGATTVVARAIVFREGPSVDRLMRELPEILLIPYLGAQGDRGAASPDG